MKIPDLIFNKKFIPQVILATFADREQMITQLDLPRKAFDHLRSKLISFYQLSQNEAILLMAVALTSGNLTESISKLHKLIWKCAHSEIFDRLSDNENCDPLLCYNLVKIFSHLYLINWFCTLCLAYQWGRPHRGDPGENLDYRTLPRENLDSRTFALPTQMRYLECFGLTREFHLF